MIQGKRENENADDTFDNTMRKQDKNNTTMRS